MSGPLVPQYGTRTLAEVLPSLLGALGAAGEPNPLAVPPARTACLLLVDGLGAELLAAHRADAPALAELSAGSEPLRAGFPATTATGIASLGTGRPPAEHGIPGYAFAAGPDGLLLNALGWCVHASSDRADLRERITPEALQPHPTALQRAARAGLDVVTLTPRAHHDSGLSRAALRGGTNRSVHAMGDLSAGVLDVLGADSPALGYAYHAELDTLGHIHGPGSLPWRLQLSQIDMAVAVVLERQPAGSLLAVVADHGMVELADPVDADTDSRLSDGVRALGGDVRARHVYTAPGAADDVLAAWRAVLGDRAWVVSREEAITAGWFGPRPEQAVAERIGDVLVAARESCGVIRSAAEPKESALWGHHGSLTSAEQLVPFLTAGWRC